MNERVVVATFLDPEEPLFIKKRFEKKGIECQIKNDFSSFVQTFGNVSIEIDRKEIPAASEILEDSGYPTSYISARRISRKSFHYKNHLPLYFILFILGLCSLFFAIDF